LPRKASSKNSTNEVNLTETAFVVSNTMGGVVLVDPNTRREWHIESYGKRRAFPIGDLLNILSEQSSTFQEGFAYVDADERILNYLGLQEVDKLIVKPGDVDKFLSLPEPELKDRCQKMPLGMKITMIKILREKVKNEDKLLDSYGKIKFFEEVFNTKLTEAV